LTPSPLRREYPSILSTFDPDTDSAMMNDVVCAGGARPPPRAAEVDMIST
jgi:hypothetical protein